MTSEVMLRLEGLGYPVSEADTPAVEQAMELAREELCSICNSEQVPEGLHGLWIERTCVKYLRGLGVTSVKMGDVTLKFRDDLSACAGFRKLVW